MAPVAWAFSGKDAVNKEIMSGIVDKRAASRTAITALDNIIKQVPADLPAPFNLKLVEARTITTSIHDLNRKVSLVFSILSISEIILSSTAEDHKLQDLEAQLAYLYEIGCSKSDLPEKLQSQVDAILAKQPPKSLAKEKKVEKGKKPDKKAAKDKRSKQPHDDDDDDDDDDEDLFGDKQPATKKTKKKKGGK